MRRTPDGADVVIVTGASRGVGLETCKRFAAAGWSVGMIARDRAALEAARDEVAGCTQIAPADVSDRRELEDALRAIGESLGPPRVLVNNAGQGQWGAVIDTTPDEFRRAIEVNYLGAVNATGFVLEEMIRRGEGHIINIASIAGRISAPFEAAYSASKFALVGYSEALAIELAGTGVNVSVLECGPIETGFFRRRGTPRTHRRPEPLAPERVADAIYRVAGGRGRERFIPRWLRAAHVAGTLLPPARRIGTRSMYRRQRRELRNRFR